MPIRAVRGAIQLQRDDRDHLLRSTAELVTKVLHANDVDPEQLVSVHFTATPDIRSEFPAIAARELGLGDVPFLCSVEMDVDGALPLVIRVLVLAELDVPRAAVQHVYLRGAADLRVDLAQ